MDTNLFRKIGVFLLIIMLIIPPVMADVVTQEWSNQPRNSVPTDSALSQHGDVAIVSYADGSIVAIETNGNNIIWTTNIGSSVKKIVVDPEATHVFAYGTSNIARMINADTGDILWSHESSDAILDIDMSLSYYGMIVTGTNIIVKDKFGNVYTDISYNKNNFDTEQPMFVKAVMEPNTGYIVAGMSDNTARKYKINDHTESWHVDGYQYRREHRIVGSSQVPIQNYGIPITVYRTNGTTINDKIYVDDKCRTDFNDIRFVSKETGAILQHTKNGSVENGMNFLVKIPNLEKNQAYNFYIYYGNNAASTDVSNGVGFYDGIAAVTGGNWMMETTSGWAKTIDDGIYPDKGGFVWKYAPIVSITSSSEWKTQGTKSMRLEARPGGRGRYSTNNYFMDLTVFDDQTVYATQSFPGFSGVNSDVTKGNMIFDVKLDVIRADLVSNYVNFPSDVIVPGKLKIVVGNREWIKNIDIISGMTPTTQTYIASDVSLPINKGEIIKIEVIDAKSIIYKTGNYNYGAITSNVIAYIDNIRFQLALNSYPTHSTWEDEIDYPVDGFLQDTETLDSTIQFMDMSWSGNKVSIATNDRLYSLEIDDNGIKSSTFVVTSGIPYDLMSGSDNNYVIEGRGLKALIYQSGTTLVGSQTGGNVMRAVSLSEITGTWAIGASDDNHVYVFSKSNTSTWAYVWGTTPPELAKTVAFSARGTNFMYAIDSGYIYFYSSTATSTTYPDVFITIHITKNGAPYAGAVCDVYYSDTGTGYIIKDAGVRADSNGKLIVNAITGDYYRIVVKGPDGVMEGSQDIHVSRTSYDYYLSIITHAKPGTTPSFITSYDKYLKQITARYSDPGRETSNARLVITKIDEDTMTKEVVMSRSDFDNPNNFVVTYTIPDDGASYQVEVFGKRDKYDYYNVNIITPTGKWSIVDDIPGIYHVNALLTWIFIGGLAYAGSRRSIGITLFLVLAIVLIAGALGLIAITMESVSFAIVLIVCSYILSRTKGGN